jgi:ketol-acid reductoisomerase
MKYTSHKAKGRNKAHWDTELPTVVTRSPNGLQAALKEAVKKLPKRKTKTQFKKEFRRSVFIEQQTTKAQNIKRWRENESKSLIETPENKRRNMIRAAWNSVTRREEHAKKRLDTFNDNSHRPSASREL